MEENIIIVGEVSPVKRIIGSILLLFSAFVLIAAIIAYASSGNFSVIVLALVYIIPIATIGFTCVKNQSSITVTNKRVFGEVTKWLFITNRIDLPLDSISSVALGSAISVSTSSGTIAFKGIRNRVEVHQAINRLLMARQSTGVPVIVQESRPSVPEELKQYKELLDSGLITQEEFDEKKRQILGL